MRHIEFASQFVRRYLEPKSMFAIKSQMSRYREMYMRRLHADLVWCYRIYFNLVDINFDDFFTFSAVTNTRDHKYKLYKLHSRCNTRSFFFTERVVNV